MKTFNFNVKKKDTDKLTMSYDGNDTVIEAGEPVHKELTGVYAGAKAIGVNFEIPADMVLADISFKALRVPNVIIEYKKKSDTSWTQDIAVPINNMTKGSAPSYYSYGAKAKWIRANIIGLEFNTEYDVRLKNGAEIYTASVKTKQDTRIVHQDFNYSNLVGKSAITIDSKNYEIKTAHNGGEMKTIAGVNDNGQRTIILIPKDTTISEANIIAKHKIFIVGENKETSIFSPLIDASGLTAVANGTQSDALGATGKDVQRYPIIKLTGAVLDNMTADNDGIFIESASGERRFIFMYDHIDHLHFKKEGKFDPRYLFSETYTQPLRTEGDNDRYYPYVPNVPAMGGYFDATTKSLYLNLSDMVELSKSRDTMSKTAGETAKSTQSWNMDIGFTGDATNEAQVLSFVNTLISNNRIKIPKGEDGIWLQGYNEGLVKNISFIGYTGHKYACGLKVRNNNFVSVIDCNFRDNINSVVYDNNVHDLEFAGNDFKKFIYGIAFNQMKKGKIFHDGEAFITMGKFSYSGLPSNIDIYNNRFEFGFDGVGTGKVLLSSMDQAMLDTLQKTTQEISIHDNEFYNLGDDMVSAGDGYTANIRTFNNSGAGLSVVLASAPSFSGPSLTTKNTLLGVGRTFNYYGVKSKATIKIFKANTGLKSGPSGKSMIIDNEMSIDKNVILAYCAGDMGVVNLDIERNKFTLMKTTATDTGGDIGKMVEKVVYGANIPVNLTIKDNACIGFDIKAVRTVDSHTDILNGENTKEIAGATGFSFIFSKHI